MAKIAILGFGTVGSGVAAAQSADTAPVVGQDTTGLDTD